MEKDTHTHKLDDDNLGSNSTILFNNKCHQRGWDHLNRVEREERNMDRCAGVAVGDARSVVVEKLTLLRFLPQGYI